MKIVVVDDNPTNRKLAVHTLSIKGHEIIEAESGEEGIQMILSQKPDLVLMDIQMSGMDGIEALKRIRSEKGFEKLPVIALTAYAMAGDMERLIGEGFDDYISKPFNISDLLEKVATYEEK